MKWQLWAILVIFGLAGALEWGFYAGAHEIPVSVFFVVLLGIASLNSFFAYMASDAFLKERQW